MTLDDRIKQDLSELYNRGNTPGIIQEALKLNDLIKSELGQTSFATKALPGYYTGDRKAKTVMVMLNPGIGVHEANDNLICDIMKHSMENAGDFVNYHKWCADYGHKDKMRHDNFDLKQAFFLHNWKDTGISLPENLCANPKSDRQILLDAKEAVLTQKLQLELIPYASSSFKGFNKKKSHLVFPFVETMFDEIFSYERKYVIFCSKMFSLVFNEFEKEYPGTINEFGTCSQLIADSKIKGSCTVISINYHNKTVNAIIANTFSSQALPNSYEKMEKYGDFCFNIFKTYINTSPTN